LIRETLPGVLVPDPGDALEVVTGEVLRHVELVIRRLAEDVRSIVARLQIESET